MRGQGGLGLFPFPFWTGDQGLTAFLAGWELIDGDRSLHGFGGGGAMPLVHHRRFARLAAAGPLDLSKVVSHRYPLAEAEKALEQVAAGVGGRSVLIPH